MIKPLTIALTVLALYGCATAKPELNNGKYYMTGDSQCLTVEYHDENTIKCFNEDKELTELRTALTDHELALWRQEQAMRKLQQPEPQHCYTRHGINPVTICRSL